MRLIFIAKIKKLGKTLAEAEKCPGLCESSLWQENADRTKKDKV